MVMQVIVFHVIPPHNAGMPPPLVIIACWTDTWCHKTRFRMSRTRPTVPVIQMVKEQPSALHSTAWCNSIEKLFFFVINMDCNLVCTSWFTFAQLNISKQEVFISKTPHQWIIVIVLTSIALVGDHRQS